MERVSETAIARGGSRSTSRLERGARDRRCKEADEIHPGIW
jgi:hypothetical protein